MRVWLAESCAGLVANEGSGCCRPPVSTCDQDRVQPGTSSGDPGGSVSGPQTPHDSGVSVQHKPPLGGSKCDTMFKSADTCVLAQLAASAFG